MQLPGRKPGAMLSDRGQLDELKKKKEEPTRLAASRFLSLNKTRNRAALVGPVILPNPFFGRAAQVPSRRYA